MKMEQAVQKIQYSWRLHRVRNVLDEALSAEIEKRAISRLQTLQRTFRVKLRKRFLEALVSEAVYRIERIREREEIYASASGTPTA